MALPYEEQVYFLKELGLLDVILPFILFFVIVYALLERTHVLGKKVTKLNAMVAFVAAFLGIASIQVLNITNYLVAYLTVLLIAGILCAVIVSLAGIAKPENLPGAKPIAFGAFALAVLYAFSVAGYIDMSGLTNFISVPTIILLLTAFVIYTIVKTPKEKPVEPSH